MTGAVLDPFFLVGCPRSGTTLLQAQLDAHPAVAVAPETFYVRSYHGKPRRYDVASDEGRARLVRDLCETPEFAAMGLDGARFAAAVEAAPHTWGEPLRALLQQYAAVRGATRVGEKTPNHLLAMRTLEEWFPGASFVHVVRDPRAVAASWRDVPWTNGSLASDAAVWRKYQRAARRSPPRNGRLLTVRYEELVAAPAEVLAGVCEFLDLAFDEAMLRHEGASDAVADVLREPWKAGVRRPVTTARAERWRDELTSAEVRSVEAAVWPELVRAGYVPVHGTAALSPWLMGAAAARGAKRWRKARRNGGRS